MHYIWLCSRKWCHTCIKFLHNTHQILQEDQRLLHPNWILIMVHPWNKYYQRFLLSFLTGSHHNSIQMIRDNRADVAAIDSIVLHHYKNQSPAETSSELHTLAYLGPFPVQPIVINTRLPGEEQSFNFIWYVHQVRVIPFSKVTRGGTWKLFVMWGRGY